MSIHLYNAVLFRVSCSSDYSPENVQCGAIEFSTVRQARLLALMDMAAAVKEKEPCLYWLDLYDHSLFIVGSGLSEELYEKVECEGAVYVPYLCIPEHGDLANDFMTIRVDDTSVKWDFRVRHSSVDWETEWFNREDVLNYLSPTRALFDRYQEKQNAAEEAQI